MQYSQGKQLNVMSIPMNCTDRLQPMDLSVNKSAKDFMRQKLRDRSGAWYSSQVFKLLDGGAKMLSPVDLKLSIMKPLVARWLISIYDCIRANDSLIINSFKAAGTINALNS